MLWSKSKPVEALSHWYALVLDFTTSPQDFFTTVETDLKAREVPGLTVERIEFAEGGPVSAQRQYLRLTRERLIFDLCAAPFGTAFFFSCRFAELPAKVSFWELLGVVILLGVAFVLLSILLTPLLGPLVFFVLIFLAVWAGRNSLSPALKDIDSFFLKLPLFGSIYARYLRKETYYRQDTRLMYCDLVNTVVKEQVERVTGAKGIKLLRFNEHSPLLDELYRPTTVVPQAPPPRAQTSLTA